MLLHDAPEYVIGDMISPFKAVIGDAYKSVENRILDAMLLRFSLPVSPPAATLKLAKQADRAAAFFEAVSLAGFTRRRSRAHLRPPGDLAAGSDGRDHATRRGGDADALSRPVL